MCLFYCSHGFEDGGVAGEEAVFVVHEVAEDFGVGELQVVSSASPHAAEADGVEVFVVGLGHGAVVEGEFLSEGDVFEGVHADVVASVGDGDDGAAVGFAGVAESAGEVAFSAGVDDEYVAAEGFVWVFL